MVQAAGDSKPVLPKQSLTLCQTQELRTAGCYRLLLAQHTPHPTAVPYDTEFRIQIRKIVRYEVPGMIQQQYGCCAVVGCGGTAPQKLYIAF